jgi:hypothetical protein
VPKRKRAAVEQGDGAPVDYHANLIEAMQRMAHRSPHMQPELMQLARAGGLQVVVKYITNLREYVKRATK